ncbi:hypothetical protein AJ78_02880 [Emergomyces pasteurianus Ep9510]|uniref:Uncharacterized protein n=1 Tax=Emergomyces pasteurianus Ep9510 TaxID=1447872 RepID=A0A1J9QLC4_9EURO|nr:hypothetical protein AJ78_02880 [Emergomyces pasteurianus Ep9510]
MSHQKMSHSKLAICVPMVGRLELVDRMNSVRRYCTIDGGKKPDGILIKVVSNRELWLAKKIVNRLSLIWMHGSENLTRVA